MRLKLGPVNWFWQPEKQIGGLLGEAESGVYSVAQEFSGHSLKQIASLYNEKQGQLYFDPTLTHALQLANNKETLIQQLT